MSLDAQILEAVRAQVDATLRELLPDLLTSPRELLSREALVDLGLGPKDADRIFDACPHYAAPGEDARRRYVRREDVAKAMRKVDK